MRDTHTKVARVKSDHKVEYDYEIDFAQKKRVESQKNTNKKRSDSVDHQYDTISLRTSIN